MPEWSGTLCNLYWHLRFNRFSQAARRRFYRKIAAEKKRLVDSGVDTEEVRLFCRWMANPRNRFAEERYYLYSGQARLW